MIICQVSGRQSLVPKGNQAFLFVITGAKHYLLQEVSYRQLVRVTCAPKMSSLAIVSQAGIWQNWSREFEDIGRSGNQDLGIRRLGDWDNPIS